MYVSFLFACFLPLSLSFFLRWLVYLLACFISVVVVDVIVVTFFVVVVIAFAVVIFSLLTLLVWEPRLLRQK